MNVTNVSGRESSLKNVFSPGVVVVVVVVSVKSALFLKINDPVQKYSYKKNNYFT